MKKELTLLILAAGMGSRFGGLKQIEPVGPNNEFIIDYSVYDAIRAGFTKIVFVIKEENYQLFKETIGNRISNKIKVEYVFQKLDDLPNGYKLPKDRIKPWGTAHAILSAKDKIKENFAIINADDFYGSKSYELISNFLKENNNPNTYALIGYKVKNTLTDNGSVKRGICKTHDNYLDSIIESSIIKEDNKIIATPLNKKDSFTVLPDSLVSMNMLGFTPSIFPLLEENFSKFLDINKDNILNCEYLIPDMLEKSIKDNYAKTVVIETTSKWEGVTYKEDKEKVVSAINKLIKEGKYPYNLWDK